MHPETAREKAIAAEREADHAAAAAWSIRLEGLDGPAQPSPTLQQCFNGGLGWLEVECGRCRTRPSLSLQEIRAAAGHAHLEARGFPALPVVLDAEISAACAVVKLTAREIWLYRWERPGNEW
jgi:hypothetical protein